MNCTGMVERTIALVVAMSSRPGFVAQCVLKTLLVKVIHVVESGLSSLGRRLVQSYSEHALLARAMRHVKGKGHLYTVTILLT